ncbi:hypothetical protein ACS0TY_020328 [Phlomoides rotata]
MGLRIQNYMGFYHIARCGAMVMDCHHITALVERWRLETHTFHFPIGEATVTLQDVAIIWGLHIDGDPLSIDEHHYTADVELVWTWSRIPAIQPTNRGDRLLQTSLEGFTGRNLGLPPYGSRWNTHHCYVQTTRFSIRVYRDIFDRMNDRDFHWVVYDMESLEIAALDDRCRTLNWMSECRYHMLGHLNIAANEVTTSSTPSVEALKHASYDVVRNASHLLGRQPLNYEPYITEPSTVRHCAAEPSTTGHYTVGPSTQEHYPVW